MQREDMACHTRSGWVTRFKAFAGTLRGALNDHSTHAMLRERAVRDEIDALEKDKARVGPYTSGH